MLDNETKRRIDNARDILVGKLPNPQSQVEQITIALIYKFMDDMDAQSVEYGGEASFFTGDYAKYAWSKLFAPALGGHERLALYGEAIVELNRNPNLPQLFRDIFKNAFLPYRDPETLTLFLKTINEFKYDHSERLGDAFEYLLSVLGSQGDAGQFRTPRHIIDFIVDILDPKKDETICDPACGTAGFLISSYKHILENNQRALPGDLLSPDERSRMMKNFVGYDISPDMVRLSLVNLYLHGFPDPSVIEYDTLTSEDRWNETFDIILANPPFMSPKGGIKPHKKFSISANRSEVLFVDYIAEHIHPAHGRAGIIVPEGIIFQSATAYKSLRKMLVEDDYLYAVVSLPAGVFNPYSGVKTSILLMDRTLAKKSDKILFVKITNDGYGLGAQRREQSNSDLPDALNLIRDFQKAVLAGDTSGFDTEDANLQAVAVEKTRIAKNWEYGLSGERYRVAEKLHHKFNRVELGEVCERITDGSHFSPTTVDRGYPYITVKDIKDDRIDFKKCKFIDEDSYKSLVGNGCKPIENDVLFSKDGTVGKVSLVDFERDFVVLSSLAIVRPNKSVIIPEFLKIVLKSERFITEAIENKTGVAIKRIVLRTLKGINIPLPPLSVQKEIVEKIEGYQRIIDGAKQVVENYKPQIEISPNWDVVQLGEACEIKRGKFSHRPRNAPEFYGGDYPFLQTGDVVRAKGGRVSHTQTLNELGLSVSKIFEPTIVLITIAANIGDTAILEYEACFPDSVVGLIPKSGTDPFFLEMMMRSQKEYLNRVAPQAAQKNINIEILTTVKIPLPPLEVQKEIVARINQEQELVNANKELIKIFEQKIKTEIAKLWEE